MFWVDLTLAGNLALLSQRSLRYYKSKNFTKISFKIKLGIRKTKLLTDKLEAKNLSKRYTEFLIAPQVSHIYLSFVFLLLPLISILHQLSPPHSLPHIRSQDSMYSSSKSPSWHIVLKILIILGSRGTLCT